MKIETEILKFRPDVNLAALAEKAKWTDLQKQYLNHLLAQDTIELLTERLYKNGWLVNFQLLFNLIEDLVKYTAITNVDIISYFESKNIPKNLELSNKKLSLSTEISTPSLSDLEKIIQQSPFFRNLPRELSFLILKNSVLKKIKMNTAICLNGATDRNMYILTSGQAAVYKPTTTGKQFVSLINPPGLFGESSFLLDRPKSADVVATQNSEVLEIPYESNILDSIIKKNTAEALIHRFWIQNALSNSSFFKNIPADCLDALTFSGKIIQLKKNQVLFLQNDLSQAAYLVIQGQIKITQNNQTIAMMNQGQFFGEVSLTLSNGRRTASAESVGEAALLEINQVNFYKLLSKNLFLAKEIQNLALQRARSDS